MCLLWMSDDVRVTSQKAPVSYDIAVLCGEDYPISVGSRAEEGSVHSWDFASI